MKTFIIIWTIVFIIYKVSELTLSIIFTYIKPDYKTDSLRANYWLSLMRLNRTREDWIKYVLGTPLAFVGAPIGFIGIIAGAFSLMTSTRIK